jgi:hypothetical protein
MPPEGHPLPDGAPSMSAARPQHGPNGLGVGERLRFQGELHAGSVGYMPESSA